ncbi:MAG: hypothetical protein IPP71_13255 [Bacteroidetes bacterium]|nr:hypothetical protein [Bacteroidota bacterium]
MKIDSTLIPTVTGVIIKDGIVTFKNGNSVCYKVFSPTTRTWVVGSTASSGIDSLKIVNGTVKWKILQAPTLKQDT